jgi:hypothetical protein
VPPQPEAQVSVSIAREDVLVLDGVAQELHPFDPRAEGYAPSYAGPPQPDDRPIKNGTRSLFEL